MMAVVWPYMELELLERLCDKIAEVHAAKRVVEYLKVAEIEEMKKKRLELAKRTPTYQTLIDILKEREERFEDIILDVMESLQKKIEDYAKSCTTMAVHDYVGDLVGSFRNIIYFDPKRDRFISAAKSSGSLLCMILSAMLQGVTTRTVNFSLSK